MALGSLVDSPLQQNPLAGGNDLMAGGGGLGEISGIVFNPPKQEAPPLAEVYTNPVTKQLLDDFGKSDFAKNVNHMQQDHMEIDLNGLPISGNGSFIGNLMQYLKSVGKDNMVSNKNLQKFEPLAQVPGQELLGNPNPYTVNYGGSDVGPNVGNEIAVPDNQLNVTDTGSLGPPIGLDGKPIGPGLQDLVSPTTPPTPTIPKLDGTVGFPVTVSGDDSIASTATVNPYQEQFTGFGNQLTGFGDQLTGFNDQFGGLDKQFDTINTRLNSMDEGIAGLSELLQPQQKLYNSPYSNFNFRNNSYSNPSPFGLGSLFGRRY